MKRSILMVFVAAAALFAGCSEDTIEVGTSPGYTIYGQAIRSNDLAMDGVNIAIRFAKLMAEAEASGASMTLDTEANWALTGDFVYPYNNVSYNKKEFLLGDTNDLTITEEESGVYVLNYWIKSGPLKGAFSSAWFDIRKRKGAYKITTNNLPLEQTSESSPWEITICNDGSYDPADFEDDDTTTSSEEDTDSDGDGMSDDEEAAKEYEDYMTFQLGEPSLNATAYTAKLWSVGGGEFAFSVKVTFKYEYRESEWSSESTWSIDEASMKFANYGDLSLESCIRNDVEMSYASAGGESIDGYILTYLTTSPLIYNYTKSPYTQYGGVEEVTVYEMSSLNYPVPSTTVETWSSGIKRLYYNGETYTF